jgi:transposase
VAPGSKVFGDDQFLFLLPPDLSNNPFTPIQGMTYAPPRTGSEQPEALVLRTRDGRLLGKRTMPNVNYHFDETPGQSLMNMDVFTGGNATAAPLGDVCLARLGRNVLTWRSSAARPQGTLELFDPWQQRALWPARSLDARTQFSLVKGQSLAVLEPSGHFLLLELPGGRTIADLKLEPEDRLTGIMMVRSGNQYLLLTRSTKPPGKAGNVVGGGGAIAMAQGNFLQNVPGALSCPVQNGRLYGIDEQGKLMWPAPATVEEQRFLLNQPERLPVVVFACQRFEQMVGGRFVIKMRLLCLDKRTGRVLYRDDVPRRNMPPALEIVGDAKKKIVELRMQSDPGHSDNVVLAFTDKPIPPPEKNGAGNTPKRSKLSDGLWKRFDRLIEGDE